jgi:ribosome recycling factor
VREEIGNEIKKSEEDGSISEDDKFALKEEMQKIVDRVNKELDEIAESKEKEIMTI